MSTAIRSAATEIAGLLFRRDVEYDRSAFDRLRANILPSGQNAGSQLIYGSCPGSGCTICPSVNRAPAILDRKPES